MNKEHKYLIEKTLSPTGNEKICKQNEIFLAYNIGKD